ncbi:MAG: hypothetical protein GTN38_00505 [Candidatus Aenigmarchaeota archaeon]|nr:hypothetical protein [Candidatus Aenigmarchaeota archaeon]NIP40065.1 hypothetical protein [Candidatus Aenigmarchaeota archaeon]NIQ18142.1 hypothetical protein [Candidatus Aenigmarchaeota archaeon]NIS72899.1 hypothetical protein [Candidatus Aenigmarchaeota archaeon]
MFDGKVYADEGKLEKLDPVERLNYLRGEFGRLITNYFAKIDELGRSHCITKILNLDEIKIEESGDKRDEDFGRADKEYINEIKRVRELIDEIHAQSGVSK